MNLGLLKFFFIILLYSHQVWSEPVQKQYANFKLLDKISNKLINKRLLFNEKNIKKAIIAFIEFDRSPVTIIEKSIKVNESDFIETLNIQVFSCFTEPPNEIPENYVLIEVKDHFQEQEISIYKGWMISSSPDVTPLEHPIYDLWLLGCSNDNTS